MKPTCKYCGSAKLQRRGSQPRQRYQCMGCGKYSYGETPIARVLLFDIETLPMEVYTWRMGDQSWDPDRIIRDWCLLSISVKWLFEAKSYSMALTPKEALAHDDRRLVEKVHTVFEQADVIIAHNGDHFDVPRMNTRFLYYGMSPIGPKITVDTLALARKHFDFSSNKLAYLARYLGLNPKLPTDFNLWVKCAHGDKEAIEYMRKYNEQDIYTLEDVYVVMRPYINHPNMSLFMHLEEDVEVCPRCGSEDIQWDGKYHTTAGVFESFTCTNCGGKGRKKKRNRTSPVRVI